MDRGDPSVRRRRGARCAASALPPGARHRAGRRHSSGRLPEGVLRAWATGDGCQSRARGPGERAMVAVRCDARLSRATSSNEPATACTLGRRVSDARRHRSLRRAGPFRPRADGRARVPAGRCRASSRSSRPTGRRDQLVRLRTIELRPPGRPAPRRTPSTTPSAGRSEAGLVQRLLHVTRTPSPRDAPAPPPHRTASRGRGRSRSPEPLARNFRHVLGAVAQRRVAPLRRSLSHAGVATSPRGPRPPCGSYVCASGPARSAVAIVNRSLSLLSLSSCSSLYEVGGRHPRRPRRGCASSPGAQHPAGGAT